MGDDFFGTTDILDSLGDSDNDELDVIDSIENDTGAGEFDSSGDAFLTDAPTGMEQGEKSTAEEFNFDEMFTGNSFDAMTEDDFIVDSESLMDGDGDIVVLAMAQEGSLVYLCHGTAHRLKDVAGYLSKMLGGNLVRIVLDGEDIDSIKDSSTEFERVFKKYVEA